MKQLNEIVREEMEKFDINPLFRKTEYNDKYRDDVKNLILSSNLHLLESIKEWAEGNKQWADEANPKQENNIKIYNEAFDDLIKHLSEQIEEINK